jgi:hypothetical protein
MGLILPIVFLGLMASLSPATIVVFVLVLGTARASVNALGFLIGWGLSLTLVFIGSYALARSGASGSQGGRTTVAVLQILLGLASSWSPHESGDGARTPPNARPVRRAGVRTGSWVACRA